jgi:hypothetical protein
VQSSTSVGSGLARCKDLPARPRRAQRTVSWGSRRRPPLDRTDPLGTPRWSSNLEGSFHMAVAPRCTAVHRRHWESVEHAQPSAQTASVSQTTAQLPLGRQVLPGGQAQLMSLPQLLTATPSHRATLAQTTAGGRGRHWWVRLCARARRRQARRRARSLSRRQARVASCAAASSAPGRPMSVASPPTTPASAARRELSARVRASHWLCSIWSFQCWVERRQHQRREGRASTEWQTSAIPGGPSAHCAAGQGT